MATRIETNTYFKKDMVIKETIVDGDIFEIIEQYLDENGELIYEYKHDYDTEELKKIHADIVRQNHDLDYYGAKGVMRVINAEERRKVNEARERRKMKEKNKAQYNAKLKKKLEKNRRRG